jgi:4-amino-4-deoxy-L-arabinose transferase-like glycosyltransferase
MKAARRLLVAVTSSHCHRVHCLVERRFPIVGILALFCGLLFFYRLGAGEFYRTESLRAILAAEVLRTGNWVVPTLYGEPLLTKPPGMYVAIALASWPVGHVTEWTARFPSALAATVMVFLFYWTFSRQLGRAAGLVAAVLLPLSMMWLDKASSAEIDMLQTGWVTGSLLCFFRAVEADETGERGMSLGLWLAALACVAGGTLTKWTAPAFFYATVLPFLWRHGQFRLLWSRNHLMGVGIASALCLAWAGAAVAIAGWGVFYQTVAREALVRFSVDYHQQALQHEHIAGWPAILAYPFRVWAASLPVSAFALPALWPGLVARLDERGQRLVLFFHCWIWPNLLLWSLIPEKAVRHSFPLVPGIAGLAAVVWTACLSGQLAWHLPRLAPGRVLIGLVAGWLIVKAAMVHVVIPTRSRAHTPRTKGEQIAAHLPVGNTLYLFHLKDEGLMFYYGRPVQRLKGPAYLPSSDEPLYCILDEAEWREWSPERPAQVVLCLRDGQGAPIVLVRIAG